MVQLFRYGCTEMDETQVFQKILVRVEVDNPDNRYETCALCKNAMYPKCVEVCAILRRDLKSDEEGLA